MDIINEYRKISKKYIYVDSIIVKHNKEPDHYQFDILIILLDNDDGLTNRKLEMKFAGNVSTK